jgi:hypothetical protein
MGKKVISVSPHIHLLLKIQAQTIGCSMGDLVNRIIYSYAQDKTPNILERVLSMNLEE